MLPISNEPRHLTFRCDKSNYKSPNEQMPLPSSIHQVRTKHSNIFSFFSFSVALSGIVVSFVVFAIACYMFLLHHPFVHSAYLYSFAKYPLFSHLFYFTWHISDDICVLYKREYVHSNSSLIYHLMVVHGRVKGTTVEISQSATFPNR